MRLRIALMALAVALWAPATAAPLPEAPKPVKRVAPKYPPGAFDGSPETVSA